MDSYTVSYKDKEVGYYSAYDDGTAAYYTAWGSPWDMEDELSELGLDKEIREGKDLRPFADIIKAGERVPGRKRIIYKSGDILMERQPQETGESYSVYRRAAEEGEPDYSPLNHDAPHYEGPHTPEGMKEWASHYCFNRMDDGTYEAELDEAWWWGGGHNDGGTIHREIPEEWFGLPYEEFLERTVTLAAAAHYGFTAEMLLEKKGLREFFGYGNDSDPVK